MAEQPFSREERWTEVADVTRAQDGAPCVEPEPDPLPDMFIALLSVSTPAATLVTPTPATTAPSAAT